MQPLVLITYLALVLAVAGQAVDGQKEAPAAPQELQVDELPSRDDNVRDTALNQAKPPHENANLEHELYALIRNEGR